MEQEQFVGFDVSQAETSVCVVDETGKVLWQGKCASAPEAMAAIVKRRAPYASRIAIETGSMSAWHYRSLTALGLPVVCVDARHAKAALAMQLNKTDADVSDYNTCPGTRPPTLTPDRLPDPLPA